MDAHDDPPSVSSLLLSLTSDSDPTQKLAVFRLQTLLHDPSFADAFLQAQGARALRACILDSQGNTLAYALGSLNALLELGVGWEAVDSYVIARAVELAAGGGGLVNIVRNALTLLVLVVSRVPDEDEGEERVYETAATAATGFRAIKPALDAHPEFLKSLVGRLSASDHTLCANALQLVNALMRDAVLHGGESEWPKFIKRLQDLGVIGGVGMLMRGEAAGDASSPLTGAILEFQGLTKVLLRKWRSVGVSPEIVEHKRALKTVHLLSRPERFAAPAERPQGEEGVIGDEPPAVPRKNSRKQHHPTKWRRLGFETESPFWEFDETGYLGIMDLVDYARRNESAYHRLFLEQAAQLVEQRCPLARASLGVTLVLYEHFEIDETADVENFFSSGAGGGHARGVSGGAVVGRALKPLLLQWGRLHTAALNAFLRLWKLSGAEAEDFYKIEELVRIIVERIIGGADRKTEVGKIEEEFRTVSLETARAWQMEGLEEVYQDAWDLHLEAVREQLYHESLQFMREQRIRCLLEGSWFPTTISPVAQNGVDAGAVQPPSSTSRFVRLHPNRQTLHYSDFACPTSTDPSQYPEIDALPQILDLSAITSVDSNVSASGTPPAPAQTLARNPPSSDTLTRIPSKPASPSTSTTLTILGSLSAASPESTLLTLHPQTTDLASEWLDGLLLLLDQQPITKATTETIDMMVNWGVRLRMLNLRWEDVDWSSLEKRVRREGDGERELPDREGLDDDFWYA
nr:hypothetical protein B0A51_09047 [Rachicladosporium sp. CCFEE 5018]